MIPNYRLQNLIASLALGAVCAAAAALLFADSAAAVACCLFGGLVSVPFLEFAVGKFNPSPAVRKALEAKARSNGTALLRRVIARKRARGTVLHPGHGMQVRESEDLLNIVEACDISEAIGSGMFTKEESSLLRFIAHNMSTFGRRVGRVDVAVGHHGTTMDYYGIDWRALA